MTDEEKTREQIIDIVNNEEPVNEDVKEEIVKEEVKEIVKEEVKEKPKRASRAKVKIVKESVEPVVEVVEVIEKPEPKVDKLKSIVQCPDCLLSMTVHTLKYIHKRRGFCKAVKTEVVPETVPPVPDQPKLKPKITEDIVNEYIKDNPDIVSTYLRNERAMKAQRKQMNARSLLNNAF